MKTQYAVTRNGSVLVESDDLDYIKRMKSELEVRQTGRTTRMIFRALGDPNSEVVIVTWNRHQVRHLMDMVGEIFKSLGFDYVSNTIEGTIINFGKTYHFVTSDYMSSIHCKFHKRNVSKYLDQK